MPRDLYAPVQAYLRGQASLRTVELAIEEEGADPNSWLGPLTPIRCAVENDHKRLLEVLLRARADPNLHDARGVCPLHMAVFDGRVPCVAALLDGQANVNIRDQHGQTPLFFAPSREICELLISRRADVDVRNIKSQSPLHLAAHAGLDDAVEWLVGASDKRMLEAKDLKGHTPLYYAAHARLKSTISVLKKMGAEVQNAKPNGRRSKNSTPNTHNAPSPGPPPGSTGSPVLEVEVEAAAVGPRYESHPGALAGPRSPAPSPSMALTPSTAPTPSTPVQQQQPEATTPEGATASSQAVRQRACAALVAASVSGQLDQAFTALLDAVAASPPPVEPSQASPSPPLEEEGLPGRRQSQAPEVAPVLEAALVSPHAPEQGPEVVAPLSRGLNLDASTIRQADNGTDAQPSDTEKVAGEPQIEAEATASSQECNAAELQDAAAFVAADGSPGGRTVGESSDFQSSTVGEANEALHAAIEGNDVVVLDSALSWARAAGSDQELLRRGENRAKELKDAERRREAEEAILAAVEAGDVEALERATAAGREVGATVPVLQQAEDRLQSLREDKQRCEAQEALEQASAGEDAEVVAEALARAEASGVDDQRLEDGRRRLHELQSELSRRRASSVQAMHEAAAREDVEALEAAVTEAGQVGVSQAELQDGRDRLRELQMRMTRRFEAIDKLRAAERHEDDLAGLAEAVREAESVGVSADVLRSTAEKLSRLQAELQRDEELQEAVQAAVEREDVDAAEAAIVRARHDGATMGAVQDAEKRLDTLRCVLERRARAEESLDAAARGDDPDRLESAILAAEEERIKHEILQDARMRLEAIRIQNKLRKDARQALAAAMAASSMPEDVEALEALEAAVAKGESLGIGGSDLEEAKQRLQCLQKEVQRRDAEEALAKACSSVACGDSLEDVEAAIARAEEAGVAEEAVQDARRHLAELRDRTRLREEAEAELAAAARAGRAEPLRAALLRAETSGALEPVLEDARQQLREMEQRRSDAADALRVVMAPPGDAAALEAAIASAEAAEVEAESLEDARRELFSIREREHHRDVEAAVLAEASEAGEAERLRAALASAQEAGVSEAALEDARRQLVALSEREQLRDSAAAALAQAAEGDAEHLRAAIAHAEAAGVDEGVLQDARAELAACTEREEAHRREEQRRDEAQKALEVALAQQDAEKLQSVLYEAREAGVAPGTIEDAEQRLELWREQQPAAAEQPQEQEEQEVPALPTAAKEEEEPQEELQQAEVREPQQQQQQQQQQVQEVEEPAPSAPSAILPAADRSDSCSAAPEDPERGADAAAGPAEGTQDQQEEAAKEEEPLGTDKSTEQRVDPSDKATEETAEVKDDPPEKADAAEPVATSRDLPLEIPPAAVPPEDHVAHFCSPLELEAEDPFEGQWMAKDNPGKTLATIEGDAVHWANGTDSPVVSRSASKLSIELKGQTFSCNLKGDQLVWDDGDIWLRVLTEQELDRNFRPSDLRPKILRASTEPAMSKKIQFSESPELVRWEESPQAVECRKGFGASDEDEDEDDGEEPADRQVSPGLDADDREEDAGGRRGARGMAKNGEEDEDEDALERRQWLELNEARRRQEVEAAQHRDELRRALLRAVGEDDLLALAVALGRAEEAGVDSEALEQGRARLMSLGNPQAGEKQEAGAGSTLASSSWEQPEKAKQEPQIQAELKDGCLLWDVLLEKGDSEADKFGFVQANGKLDFENRLSSGSREEGDFMELPGPQVLIVRRIHPQGLLHKWNLRHPEAQVRPQDRIISVNGEETLEAMQREIRTSKILMKIMRYPEVFAVTLRREGRRLGFRIEYPQEGDQPEVRVSQLTEGALPAHNSDQVKEGMWHCVVLPDMRIQAANGTSGSAWLIAEELKSSEIVTLIVRRAEQQQSLQNKSKTSPALMAESASSSGSQPPT